MQREWCPSGVPDPFMSSKKCCFPEHDEVSRRSIIKSASCREDSAVAANMDKSAIQLASQVSIFLKTWTSRFSMASIASRVNKLHWPQSTGYSPFGHPMTFLPEGALFNYNGTFLTPFVKDSCSISSISLPADQFLSFLVSLGHMDSFEKSDITIQNLLIFPSLSKSISFEDLHPYLKCHTHLISNTRLLFLSGVRLDSNSIVSFCNDLKCLTSVSIEKCSLKDQARELFDALKDTSIEHLSVEGCDLGGTHEEIDDNETLLSLLSILKYNKFLRSVNLSYNNFTSEEIENLMTALYESDTTLSPESAFPEEGEEIKLTEEDLSLSFSYLFPKMLNVKSNSGSFSFTSEQQQEEKLSADESIEVSNEEEADEEEADEEEEGEEEENEENEEKESSQNSGGSNSTEGHDGDLNITKDAEKRVHLKKKIAHEKRLLFEEEEFVRQQIIMDYANSFRKLFDELKRLHANLKVERQQRIEAYCKARSGWSRLNSLNLRGNNIGDRGTRAIKRILKDEIRLAAKELDSIQDRLKDKFLAIVQELQERRRSLLAEELIKRQNLTEKLVRLKNLQLLHSSAEKIDKELSKISEEEENNAPDVVMSNVKDIHSKENNRDEEMPENEFVEDFDWYMEGSNITIPVLPTKAGMNSIKFLDISSCGISSNGLKAIASSLGKNKVLTTLILRNNAIDRQPGRSNQLTANAETQSASSTEGCDQLVISGFSAFVDMLRVNQALKNIDLGYCQLQPESIICLAHALRENKIISALNLEGNSQGFSRSSETQKSSLLSLLSSIEQASSLESLNLSNNDLDDLLWEEEICALANVTTRLTSLHLCNVGLNGNHIMRLVAAVDSRMCALRVLELSRNRFESKDGPHIGSFLSLCKDIRELNLDGNPKLDNNGLFSALKPLSNSNIFWLSCNGTAAVTASAIPSFIVQHLNYLSLSDIEMKNIDDLLTWVKLLAENGKNIRFLSLWSRHLDTQLNLNLLKEMVKDMNLLLYGDFGVLLRFDGEADGYRTLGEIESILSSRRAALMSRKL